MSIEARAIGHATATGHVEAEADCAPDALFKREANALG